MTDGLHLRLWCGFRKAQLPWHRFVEDLAQTFVPATWQVMRNYGLLSYVPGVLAEQRPAGIPDEVALLVYRTEAGYKASRQTVAGRSYGIMHSAVFEFTANAAQSSDSAVPTPWPGGNGGPKPRKAWHRPAATSGPSFLGPQDTLQFIALSLAVGNAPSVAKLFGALSPSGAEAAVLLAPSFALAWIAAESPAAGKAVAADLAQAAQGSQVIASHTAVPSDVTAQGNDVYHGVSLTANQSLRFLA